MNNDQASSLFPFSSHGIETLAKVKTFMRKHVAPAEAIFDEQVKDARTPWITPPILDELKAKARKMGLWNMFLPELHPGPPLSNLDYAPIAEEMGRIVWASEVFNCNAPDTGNMEVLEKYGTPTQKDRWLRPLADAKIRSCFAMTEPQVASSDATNIETQISRENDQYVINGRKWWITGALNPRCEFAILMGKTDPFGPKHRQQSMIIVSLNTPGVKIMRPLRTFGFDEPSHGHAELVFDNVKVPLENILLGEGRGFEISQGRLGPGRIHHCMRLIGLASRALEAMCARASSRRAFDRAIGDHGVVRRWIAQSRIEIDQARLLVLQAALRIDQVGAKDARKDIAMIKLAVPQMAQTVIDRAIQVFGGAGLCDDHFLAYAFTGARILRIADGPDEVHAETIARLELKAQTG